MDKSELLKLSDKDLLQKKKKLRNTSIIHAGLIGFMIGVAIYSVVENGLGFFTLIPLFLIYKVFDNPKENRALREVLKKRNLH